MIGWSRVEATTVSTGVPATIACTATVAMTACSADGEGDTTDASSTTRTPTNDTSLEFRPVLSIVPGSGTGELEGISGKGTWESGHAESYPISFEYEL